MKHVGTTVVIVGGNHVLLIVKDIVSSFRVENAVSSIGDSLW